MLLTKDKKTEDWILEFLSTGPLSSLALVGQVQGATGLTKQAVYTCLRKLILLEVVVLQKGTASLNIRWVNRMRDFLDLSEHANANLDVHGHFLGLKEGEKIQYVFRNPLQADAFWDHALLLLAKIVPVEEPFLAYSPHCWFYLAEPDRERDFREQILGQGRAYWVLVAGDTALDASIMNEFVHDDCEYHMLGKLALKKPNHYLWIIGDFLIDVCLDATSSKRIDEYYLNNEFAELDAFKAILSDRRRSRFTISRNSARALRFKKKWGVYFK